MIMEQVSIYKEGKKYLCMQLDCWSTLCRFLQKHKFPTERLHSNFPSQNISWLQKLEESKIKFLGSVLETELRSLD